MTAPLYRIRLCLSAVLLIAVASCSSPADVADPGAALSSTLPAGMLQHFPALPAVEREATVGYSTVADGNVAIDMSADATTDDVLGTLTLDPDPDELSWAIYQFGPFATGDSALSVEIHVSDALEGTFPETYFVAWANYPEQRWVVQQFDATDGTDVLEIPSEPLLQPVLSPTGNLYVAVLAFDGEPVLIDELSAHYTATGIVSGVQATDGFDQNIIYISWNTATDATSYDIYYYSETDGAGARTLLTSVAAPENQFQHTELDPPGHGSQYGEIYFYQVKAHFLDGTESDDFSLPDSGYRSLPAPQNLQATPGFSPTEIKVYWDAVEGAEGYRVYRDDVLLEEIGPVTTFIDDDGELVLEFNTHTYYLIAFVGARESAPSNSAEGALAQWSGFNITGVTAAHGDVQLALYQDKPICGYYDEAAGEIYGASFARTELEVPLLNADFSHHFIDPVTDGAGGDISLAIIDGLPAMALWNKGDASVYYARCAVDDPDATEDWTVTPIVSGEVRYGVALCEVSGGPALVFLRYNELLDATDYGLHYAVATVEEPDEAADWLTHLIDGDVVRIEDCALAVQAGGLIAPYVVGEGGAGGSFDLRCAVALDTVPDATDDWRVTNVDSDSYVSQALAYITHNGQPQIVYPDNSTPGAELRIATSATALPVNDLDWQNTFVVQPLPESTAFVRELSIGLSEGRMVIMSSLAEFDAGMQHIYTWYALEDAPVSADDWFGGSFSFSSVNDGDASMTVLSNGRPAVMYVQNAVADIWQLVYSYQVLPGPGEV